MKKEYDSLTSISWQLKRIADALEVIAIEDYHYKHPFEISDEEPLSLRDQTDHNVKNRLHDIQSQVRLNRLLGKLRDEEL